MNQAQTAGLCGSVISGRYQMIKLIGQVEMACVYLALDQKTDRPVDINVMHSELLRDCELTQRFKAECGIASSLVHPNIARILGFGQDHDIDYIVQEHVEGCPLKELINSEGTLPWRQAVSIAIQIGLALEHAHRMNIVHGAIKPAYVLITRDGTAKVTDFCIARLGSSSMVTLTSVIADGSVHYFSPEQVSGMIFGKKSYIYSFGILIYEMVTGRTPFSGDTAIAVAMRHLQDTPALPSQINHAVPHGLDKIIMKCIQKSPGNRYQDVRDLIDELDAVLIDPNGSYGVVARQPDQYGQTSALQAICPAPNYNKLREIEQAINERRRSRHRDNAIVVGIILTAMVFVISIGSWGWHKLAGTIPTEPGRTYLLENYIGRDLTEVLDQLKIDKVEIDIVYSTKTSMIAGLIIEQHPGPGVTIKPGTTRLQLTVSGAPDLHIIPDYAGRNADQVQTELAQISGLVVTVDHEPSSIEKGKVVRTIPSAGQGIPSGGSIILIISDGLPMVTMPNLIGLSFKAARSKLLSLMLILGPSSGISGDVSEADRIIIRQSIKAGSKIIEQAVISLTYGTAQDYANFLHPSPTPVPFVIMPDLDRATLASARTQLALLGLSRMTVSYASTLSRLLPESLLYVMNQNPIAGSQTELLMTIQMMVGSMAEYNAYKNPTPTPRPTPTPVPKPSPTPTRRPITTWFNRSVNEVHL